MVLEQLDVSCRKMRLDIDCMSFTKINSKWITDLNVKCKMIRLLEDNKVGNLDDLG